MPRCLLGSPSPPQPRQLQLDPNISPSLVLCQVPPQMGQMGGVPVMAAQPMMYNQPVLRPTNPFTPMPGAQVGALLQCHPCRIGAGQARPELTHHHSVFQLPLQPQPIETKSRGTQLTLEFHPVSAPKPEIRSIHLHWRRPTLNCDLFVCPPPHPLSVFRCSSCNPIQEKRGREDECQKRQTNSKRTKEGRLETAGEMTQSRENDSKDRRTAK